MGNRSAIIIRVDKNKAIEIYSHWRGDEIVARLPEALEIAKDRYDDVSYFTRIVIQNILNNIVDPNSERGAGIDICNWNNYDDFHLNNNPVFIDPTNKTVRCGGNIWKFEDIIKHGYIGISCAMCGHQRVKMKRKIEI